MSRKLLVLVLLAGCGRTDLVTEADGGVVDAGGPREAPFFVVVEDGACARPGAESDLKLRDSGERLVLLKTKGVRECSGAGGEYLVGAEVNEARDAFLGAHACFFLAAAVRDDEVYFGLARLSQTAALFQTQRGWCISTIAGSEPVTTDSKAKAWALYRSEAAARAALAALSQP